MKIIYFFAIIIFLFNSCVYAENTVEELSVDEAVEKAVSYGRKIIEKDESKAVDDESLEDTLEEIKYDSDNYNSLKVQILKLQNSLKNYDENVSVLKNDVKISVVSVFAEIIKAENEIKLEEEYLKIAEKKLAAAEIKFKRGLLSKADYEYQIIEYDKYKTNLENLRIDLSETYIALNKLIGTDIETKYKVALEMNYVPLGEIDIEQKIQEILENSIYLKEKNDDIYISEYEWNLFDSNTSYISKISKENEIKQNYRNKEEYETELEEQIRKAYSSILNSENEYEKNTAELERMKNELEAYEVKYSLGRISAVELESYKYEIKKLEYQIYAEIYNHGVLVMTLENIC